MILTILIVLLVLWACGYGAPPAVRAWGGGVGYPGLGTLIVVLLVLAILHVI